MEKYLNRNDLHMRLHGTLCLWKGEPVKVHVDDTPGYPETSITVQPLNKGGFEVIDYTSDEFTSHGIKLGYVNYECFAYFVSRLPIRRNMQGLTTGNISVSHGGPKAVLFSKSIRDCVLGKYPSIKEAMIKFVNVSTTSVAISRNFAIVAESSFHYLDYRTKRVGVLNRDGTFQIFDSPRSSFIRRALDREGL